MRRTPSSRTCYSSKFLTRQRISPARSSTLRPRRGVDGDIQRDPSGDDRVQRSDRSLTLALCDRAARLRENQECLIPDHDAISQRGMKVNKHFCLWIAAASLIGCAIPKGVDPLPYYRVDPDDNSAVQTEALCNLYRQYGFTEADCSQKDWEIRSFGREEQTDVRIIAARNELQHAILGAASSACNRFKDELVGRSTGRLTSAQTLALILSAGATFGATDQVTKGLAAVAGASTGFAQMTEERFSDEIQDTLNGIEIARSRIFDQIHDQRNSNLLEYPVSRAVNDAIRYHNVCNLEEGRMEASSALSDAVEEARNGDDD